MPKSKRPVQIPDPFESLYSSIASWVQDGWIETGRDDRSRSFVRALDIVGMVREGKSSYESVNSALQDLGAGTASLLTVEHRPSAPELCR